MTPLKIIVGPTAAGKTDLSLTLAEQLNAEIISADSMLVYRGMDIGTAKPTPAERARVAHHLIDVAEPVDVFSVGEFQRMAEEAIKDIEGRGKVPLVVGGTGLYVRSLIYGLFDGPPADRGLRDELEAREAETPGSLYEELKRVDPVAADRIKPADLRRIIRAIEVFITTGSSFSSQQRQAEPIRELRIAGLTRDRVELYGRIEQRVDGMMRDGFIDEVKKLREKGCSRGMISMQAIGYKQLLAHLDGEISLDETISLIKRDSRRYAKRQFTWFNAEPRVRWIGLTGIKNEEAIVQLKNALEISGDLR